MSEHHPSSLAPRSSASVASAPRRYSLYTPELNLLAETEYTADMTPPVQYEYVWFAGAPVAQLTHSVPSEPLTSTEVVYTVTDHLGTPRVQTDTTGAIVWYAEHEPYGEIHVMRAGAQRHQPLRFPGQEAEQLGAGVGPNGVSSRSYNIFRWYRADAGRYTQADPLLSLPAEPRAVTPGLGDPLPLPVYEYAKDAPVRTSDRLGLTPCDGCDEDCPSGGWVFTESSAGVGWIWGKILGVAVFKCVGNNTVCSIKFKCNTIGV